jgi:hypothetical protein
MAPDDVFTYSLQMKYIDGQIKYAFRGNGKQLSPLFDTIEESEEWCKHNIILKEKMYGN